MVNNITEVRMDNKERDRKIKDFILNVVTDNSDKYLREIYNYIEEDKQNIEKCLSYIKGKYNLEYQET